MRYIYSIIQKLFEFINGFFKSKGTILLFHEVEDDVGKCIDAPECWITKASFIQMIEKILERGKIVSIDSLLKTPRKNNIAITFDDVYQNFYYNAYPFLKKKNIPFTLFVTTNRIDKKPYLSMEQLRELANDELCTIGSHAMTHMAFRKMSRIQTEDEIFQSKKILTDITLKEINLFAFPYGSLYTSPPSHKKIFFKANYDYVFSTLNTHLTILTKNYYLPRFNINEKNYIDIVRRLAK